MTVAELLRVLAGVDPSLPVCVSDGEDGLVAVTGWAEGRAGPPPTASEGGAGRAARARPVLVLRKGGDASDVLFPGEAL